MFSHRRKPLGSFTSSDTSFSSDNSYVPAISTPPPVVLRQLIVRDLDDISSTGFNHQRPIQRQPFRIPRPIVTIPRPSIHVPMNNSLWTPYARPTRVQHSSSSSSSSPSLITRHSERPVYQNIPLLSQFTPPPPIPPLPIQYQIGPPPFQRYLPIPVGRPIKQKKFPREKPPGLFTTLSAGGFSTLAVLIYLTVILALPTTKLILGILYYKECPVNKNIPLYMIISGACGLAIVMFLLLSSGCTFCRSMVNPKKATYGFMVCSIAISRGMQGAIAIFLFIWFFFGNMWVFNARYRVRTDRPNDINNYCHPTLYWFAFYVLIFTYVYALFTCCTKFCINFLCCSACDVWQKAFS
jgi:hypothetical protein